MSSDSNTAPDAPTPDAPAPAPEGKDDEVREDAAPMTDRDPGPLPRAERERIADDVRRTENPSG